MGLLKRVAFGLVFFPLMAVLWLMRKLGIEIHW